MEFRRALTTFTTDGAVDVSIKTYVEDTGTGYLPIVEVWTLDEDAPAQQAYEECKTRDQAIKVAQVKALELIGMIYEQEPRTKCYEYQ